MNDTPHGFSMIAPPMPVCSTRRKLEVAGLLLLASRYQRFRLIARSFRIALASLEMRRFRSTVDYAGRAAPISPIGPFCVGSARISVERLSLVVSAHISTDAGILKWKLPFGFNQPATEA